MVSVSESEKWAHRVSEYVHRRNRAELWGAGWPPGKASGPRSRIAPRPRPGRAGGWGRPVGGKGRRRCREADPSPPPATPRRLQHCHRKTAAVTVPVLEEEATGRNMLCKRQSCVAPGGHPAPWPSPPPFPLPQSPWSRVAGSGTPLICRLLVAGNPCWALDGSRVWGEQSGWRQERSLLWPRAPDICSRNAWVAVSTPPSTLPGARSLPRKGLNPTSTSITSKLLFPACFPSPAPQHLHVEV